MLWTPLLGAHTSGARRRKPRLQMCDFQLICNLFGLDLCQLELNKDLYSVHFRLYIKESGLINKASNRLGSKQSRSLLGGRVLPNLRLPIHLPYQCINWLYLKLLKLSQTTFEYLLELIHKNKNDDCHIYLVKFSSHDISIKDYTLFRAIQYKVKLRHTVSFGVFSSLQFYS